ncbi:MAG: Holliday junction branch migration DNA helicase RuvB [Deltaproteobacteria bacterium]|nr:Holliday junction branch migration DNA helicase RuvB [Deltaproteobacteria bacterium]
MVRQRHDETSQEPVRELSPDPVDGERRVDNLLRPKNFDEYVGQDRLVENLKVFVESARRRSDVLDHVLFCGPPGLGKTTLAYIIAEEMGVGIHVTSGPAVDHKGVLAGLLTNLAEGDLLFIDEIHRLVPVVEESLYPAMEDFRLEVLIGDGPHARSVTLPLPKFTLAGATTRTGLLTSPLRDRFGVVGRLEYYSTENLTEIVRRSASRLGVEILDEGSVEIGARARGTPRIANRLLRRVWDFAVVQGASRIDKKVARYALDRLEVDRRGLDAMDRNLLRILIERFGGGPVGIDSLAAAVGEERHTLEEVVEPYLIQQGFLHRTSRGRVASKIAYEHLGLQPNRRAETIQAGLFGGDSPDID